MFTSYCCVRYFHKRKKNNTLDLPWIPPLSFCPGYSNHPAYYILRKFPTPYLLEPPPSPAHPCLFGTLEYTHTYEDEDIGRFSTLH